MAQPPQEALFSLSTISVIQQTDTTAILTLMEPLAWSEALAPKIPLSSNTTLPTSNSLVSLDSPSNLILLKPRYSYFIQLVIESMNTLFR